MSSVHDTVDEIIRRTDFGADDEPSEFEVTVTRVETYYIRAASAKLAAKAALDEEQGPDSEGLDVAVVELSDEEPEKENEPEDEK